MHSVTQDTIKLLLQKENLQPGEFSIPHPPKSIRFFRIFFLLSLSCLLFCPFLPSPISSIIIILFCVATIGDYARYRNFERQKYRQDLVNLNALLEKESLADFYKTNAEEAPTKQITNHALYPDIEVQKTFIKQQIETRGITEKKILDAGSGIGTISSLFASNGNFVTATELSLNDLQQCQSGKNIQRTVSDVGQLPFKSKKFDLVNFTDIIEHIEDPTKTLHELNRVLKNNGRLFLSTPNRHSPTLDNTHNPINPLFILERLLSLISDDILPPRRLMQEFHEANGKTVYVYHTAFSKTELITLLKDTGFTVRYTTSYTFLNRGFSFLFSKFPKSMRESGIRFVIATELLLSRLPIARQLGANIFLIAQKTK